MSGNDQIKFIDSHCHLDYEQLSVDLQSIIKRAKEFNVSKLITICTSLEEIKKIEEISSKYNFIWHTAGIHPHKAVIDKFAKDFDTINKNCEHNKCVGVGEAGLDYYYNSAPKKDQMDSFETQINVSQKIRKPIVIHSRDADKDMEEILISKYKDKSFDGVLHCFTGSKKLAKAALDIGLYISFSGIVTFKNSNKLQEIATYVPSDRYLIETDSPFLSPVPFRGETNEPKNVYFIAKFVADLRKISIDLVSKQTYQNTLNLFSNIRNQ